MPYKDYRDRVGAYAVIFNDENKIPVVKTSTGYFLPGGGIENNEAHEECIVRKCLEEVGIMVNVKEFVCKGDKYHWSDTLKYYMHGIGYFYYAEIMGNSNNQTEDDHELIWLSIDECIEKLFLEHQA